MTTKKRAGDPFMKRVDVVMQVQRGQMSADEAAEALGIARGHYYRLEEKILRAALEAATPKKRGRKAIAADPKVVSLEGRLKEAQRERELLQIRVRHLEEIQKDMVTRGIGVLREKKRHAPHTAGRRGKALHGPLPEDRPLQSRGAPGAGRDDPGALPRDGAQLREPLPLETAGRGQGETGTETARGGD
jgi:hypothetical protein